MGQEVCTGVVKDLLPVVVYTGGDLGQRMLLYGVFLCVSMFLWFYLFKGKGEIEMIWMDTLITITLIRSVYSEGATGQEMPYGFLKVIDSRDTLLYGAKT